LKKGSLYPGIGRARDGLPLPTRSRLPQCSSSFDSSFARGLLCSSSSSGSFPPPPSCWHATSPPPPAASLHHRVATHCRSSVALDLLYVRQRQIPSNLKTLTRLLGAAAVSDANPPPGATVAPPPPAQPPIAPPPPSVAAVLLSAFQPSIRTRPQRIQDSDICPSSDKGRALRSH
jgi:hypothetical protein